MTAPPGRYEVLYRLEAPLAALTLLLTWVGVETELLPSWLSLGSLTLPPVSLYPVPLATLVVAVTVWGYRQTGAVGIRRPLKATLGVLVVLTAGYAVLVLNQTSGGVFFAGMPPMLLGALLSLVVLIENGAVAVQQAYEYVG
jgi:hypothetical protein